MRRIELENELSQKCGAMGDVRLCLSDGTTVRLIGVRHSPDGSDHEAEIIAEGNIADLSRSPCDGVPPLVTPPQGHLKHRECQGIAYRLKPGLELRPGDPLRAADVMRPDGTEVLSGDVLWCEACDKPVRSMAELSLVYPGESDASEK